MRLTVITSISREFTLLPHFLAHYKAFGVSRFAAVVLGEDLQKQVASQYPEVQIVQPSQRFRTTKVHGDAEDEGRRALCLSQDDWVIPADLDEFIEFPELPQKMAERLVKKKQYFAQGRFLDRLTVDGRLTENQLTPSLWEQYPLACRLTQELVRGGCIKVVLSRGDIRLGSGHHQVVNTKLTPGHRDIEVHHFKWRASVVKALRQRAALYKSLGIAVADESIRVLNYLEKHEGRIVPEDFEAKPASYRGPNQARAVIAGHSSADAVKIAFVVTCRDRRYSLRQTIQKNLGYLYAGDVMVLLDYNCSQDTEGWVKKNLKGELESGKLLFFRDSSTSRYFSAHAKNIAHLLGVYTGAAVVVNLDADNLLSPGYVERLHQNNWTKYYCIAAESHSEGATGRIAVRSDVFLEYGGYDEGLVWGYGNDDSDFVNRLATAHEQRVKRIFMPKDSYFSTERSRDEGQPLHSVQAHAVHKEISKANIRLGCLHANAGNQWGEAELVDWQGKALSTGYTEDGASVVAGTKLPYVQSLLSLLEAGAGQPCVFLPDTAEFGHRIMTRVRIVHWHKASRKIVCCRKGEEVLYPSACEFFTDWVDPVVDTERCGSGEPLKWPEIEAKYPSHHFIQTGGLTRAQQTFCICPNEKVPFRPQLRGLKADVCLGIRCRLHFPEKNWAGWHLVADALRGAGYTFAVIGARPTTLDLSGQLYHSGDYDTDAAIELLQNCRLYVGSDTGVSHLAATVGADMAVFRYESDKHRDLRRCMAQRNLDRVEMLPRGSWNNPSAIIARILSKLKADEV